MEQKLKQLLEQKEIEIRKIVNKYNEQYIYDEDDTEPYSSYQDSEYDKLHYELQLLRYILSPEFTEDE